MRRIVLDAQYSVMTSALTMALKQGGPDFQVQSAGPKTKDIVKLCRSCRADGLLLANDLRDVCPHCKTVLLVDEAEYPELATAVCLAKKDHIVDDFVYASVSPAYLSAMMDTL